MGRSIVDGWGGWGGQAAGWAGGVSEGRLYACLGRRETSKREASPARRQRNCQAAR